MKSLYARWLELKHKLPENLKVHLNRSLRLPVRYSTSFLRTLPDFIVAGAQKSGTTSLYNYLLQHPGVDGALGQETHYFDRHHDKSTRWYRAHFPLRLGSNTDRSAGESCPDYMVHPRAPRRIRKLVPDCRLIFLLRNPVDRAYSHYRHARRKNYESLSFRQALEREEDRLANARSVAEETGEFPPEFFRHSYRYRGHYARHLKRFLDYFPRERILVLKSENFFENPKRTFRSVCGHLGVEPTDRIQFRRYNPGDSSEIPSVLRRRLKKHFRDKNEELYELLDWSEGWSDESQ